MKIEIYDPELCCSTGVCGSAPDPTLIRAEETLTRLQSEGAIVKRYQLSRQATAFTENPVVYRTLLESGTAALPITAIDGVVHFVGRYPSYEEVQMLMLDNTVKKG
ncbi:MAG: arsenical resistance operon transcriptional repressor ArsD [Sulfobacillus benefaciens]|uniref:Arsenical resistance operon transcriptional repressor ArsD n=1 Tax=Sulfobacillus benefaciens TaxID=453960 RepID=A0A2T2XEG8_9FIRM|nr:MAG: arsenical resistance operon transcriptional repressor ArsD [Sulfobacillus benefaciens]